MGGHPGRHRRKMWGGVAWLAGVPRVRVRADHTLGTCDSQEVYFGIKHKCYRKVHNGFLGPGPGRLGGAAGK